MNLCITDGCRFAWCGFEANKLSSKNKGNGKKTLSKPKNPHRINLQLAVELYFLISVSP